MEPRIISSKAVHLTGEALIRLEETADRTVAALRQAGLPAARREPGDAIQVGAVVDVDTMDDSDAGVIVGWRLHPELDDAVKSSTAAGDFTNASMAFAAATATAMLTAMTRILTAAGLPAKLGTDMLSGFVHVPPG